MTAYLWGSRLKHYTRQFSSDRSGNVAIIFTLTVMPIMGFLGASVDYSRGNSVKVAMQAAADSTALMLVKDAGALTNAQLTEQATQRFSSLFTRPETWNVKIDAIYNAKDVSLSVSASGFINTAILKMVGFKTLDIATRSVAVYVEDGLGCVLALNRNASGAGTAQGGTNVNLKGCSLYDNSANVSALVAGGSAKISARSVGVVGGISGTASITTTNGVRTGIGPIADPYAKAAFPPFVGCNEKSFSAHSTATIEPGVYCGGIQLNANAIVTLKPGIYYLDGGNLQVNGGATLTGDGVTLVFSSSTMTDWATAAINGGANLKLTPPTTGPTAGIVMFGDRRAPVGTSYKFNGGASQYLGGAIYFPTGEVNFSGGMGTGASCTKIIGDTVIFSGNSDLAVDCSGYNIKSFGLGGVRLAS
jgi:Putative Flp pilus-assembly TadE/G-like